MREEILKISKVNKKKGSSQVLTKLNQNYGEMKIKIENKTSWTNRLKDEKSQKTEKNALNNLRGKLKAKRVEIDEDLEIRQI